MKATPAGKATEGNKKQNSSPAEGTQRYVITVDQLYTEQLPAFPQQNPCHKAEQLALSVDLFRLMLGIWQATWQTFVPRTEDWSFVPGWGSEHVTN